MRRGGWAVADSSYSMSKRALITGVTGQDGSYLAEHLLAQGYEVFGIVRRSSSEKFDRINHIRDRLKLLQADLLDESSVLRAIEESEPQEIYNLAAQSFVPTSFAQPILTGEYTALGVARVLEAIRNVDRKIRFYQASSSEMYGKVRSVPQDEMTPFHPRSPYAVAKAYGHYLTVNYRESYGMFACCGILFNHESPRRGHEFVTRKVTDGVARIKHGLAKELRLGNLEARRDWGFAADYVVMMHRMLQCDEPTDYVIATGEIHSVQELCEIAFARAGLDWKEHVKLDKAYLRPSEVDHLIGDPSKAQRELNWKASVTFQGLVELMVDADLALVAREKAQRAASIG